MWEQVWDRDGAPRERDDAGVVELTGLLRASVGGDVLANWPADMRIICRRERPGSGAQLCALEEPDGWRYLAVPSTTPGKQLALLEARHRVHARVEDRVRCGKATGLDHLASTSMEINAAWCVAAMIATDLLCWLRPLCLDTAMADAEPKTLRYRILHTAASIVAGQRKRKRQGTGGLALGPRARSRVPHRVRPDRPHLSTRAQPTHPRPQDPAGTWNRSHPTRPSGHRPRQQDQRRRRRSSRGTRQDSLHRNDQGLRDGPTGQIPRLASLHITVKIASSLWCTSPGGCYDSLG